MSIPTQETLIDDEKNIKKRSPPDGRRLEPFGAPTQLDHAHPEAKSGVGRGDDQHPKDDPPISSSLLAVGLA